MLALPLETFLRPIALLSMPEAVFSMPIALDELPLEEDPPLDERPERDPPLLLPPERPPPLPPPARQGTWSTPTDAVTPAIELTSVITTFTAAPSQTSPTLARDHGRAPDHLSMGYSFPHGRPPPPSGGPATPGRPPRGGHPGTRPTTRPARDRPRTEGRAR